MSEPKQTPASLKIVGGEYVGGKHYATVEWPFGAVIVNDERYIVCDGERYDALVKALEGALLWTDEEHDVGHWRDNARAALSSAK